MWMFARTLSWWIADYAFAGWYQLRSLGSDNVGRLGPLKGGVWARRADGYRSGSLNPVVIVPGIWETWAFMRPLIEKVHAAGHPVFVVSTLGRNRRTVAASAQIVADFVESHNLTEVLIVAHSKGGMIGKYAMAMLDDSRRLGRMVAVSAPFSGSRYAKYLVLPSLRALAPGDVTTVLLSESIEVNTRIVSVFGVFDPHIPEGSRLPGARNVELPTGGHFRLLGRPETLEIVLAGAGQGSGHTAATP